MLSRITEESFIIAFGDDQHGGYLARAEAVISRPGCRELKKGSLSPAEDNQSAVIPSYVGPRQDSVCGVSVLSAAEIRISAESGWNQLSYQPEIRRVR